MNLILLLLLISPHWVRVKDAYKVHFRLENKYGNVLGEYYELTSDAFVATCYPGDPVAYPNESSARDAVSKCPAWQ